jgi:predicted small secreted protein
MRRDFHLKKRDNRALIAALLALALLTPGCTNSNLGVGTLSPAATGGTSATTSATPAAPPPASPASSPSLKDKMAGFFSGATQREPQPVTNAQPDYDCPLIDIREGASTLTIPPPPPDGSNEAMSLQYQGTFVRAARECKVASGQMAIKLGVEGRIIVGPAGGPGQVDVPLRIAVVDVDPAGAKTVATKLVRIPVTVGNDDNASFTHIEDGLSFPLPPSAQLDDYVIYIGFDPLGAAAEDKAKLKPVAKPKTKLKPNPNAPTG